MVCGVPLLHWPLHGSQVHVTYPQITTGRNSLAMQEHQAQDWPGTAVLNTGCSEPWHTLLGCFCRGIAHPCWGETNRCGCSQKHGCQQPDTSNSSADTNVLRAMTCIAACFCWVIAHLCFGKNATGVTAASSMAAGSLSHLTALLKSTCSEPWRF